MPAHPCVLVVEDHEDTRELYMTCLSLEGFEVRGAADGAEGLAEFRKHRPDLVLLDFALPRMNGLTFQAALGKPCELDEVLGAVRSAIAA